jgi:hypothetical protein
MSDQSSLDNLYFVDNHVYNCAFCNRRNVSYRIYNKVEFNWTGNKICYCYFVRCDSCGKNSMHLSYHKLPTSPTYESASGTRFDHKRGLEKLHNLDDAFFYSVPNSFFALDARIPRILRELLIEARGCLQGNFLTGASACARKIVYELGILSGAHADNYEDRIKSLKVKHPEVDPTFFDSLLTIQQVTSAKVHEGSYDGWEAKHLRIILLALTEVLHEIYVVPALREDRRNAVLALKDELAPNTKEHNKSSEPTKS